MKILLTYYSNLFPSGIQDFSILYSTFVPLMIYSNADSDKSKILADNKGRSGIYQWTHLESNKTYIGSAVNLSLRFRDYFNKSFISRNKNMHIYNALLHHGYDRFSLTIYENIDITNLSKLEARRLILKREQHYMDILQPKYNLLPNAGSSLGFNHSEKTKALMREAKLGIPKTSEHKANLSITQRSVDRFGKNNPMFGRTGESNSLSKKVFVYNYSTPIILSHEFTSCSEAALYFNCSIVKISRYLKDGKLFQKEWFLSTSKK